MMFKVKPKQTNKIVKKFSLCPKYIENKNVVIWLEFYEEVYKLRDVYYTDKNIFNLFTGRNEKWSLIERRLCKTKLQKALED